MTLRTLHTPHGQLDLPVFFPDATRAVVRAVGSRDLETCGVAGLVVNTFHLSTAPGAGLIKSVGGVHRFMNWNRPIASDSGGFQIMSMIRQNPRYGSILDRGIHFTNIDRGGDKVKFTPEKSIQVQFDLGADLMICLDDCPSPDATSAENADAVRRTVLWARRCRDAFDRLRQVHGLSDADRPLLLGVIQGGYDPQLRTECAEQLLALDFDGYGFGGWPLDAEGDLAAETLAHTAQLMPDDKPKFALGVGMPENIVQGFQMGYNIFDCVLPTRDARHGRLYAFSAQAPEGVNLFTPSFYHFLYIEDDKYKRDPRPVSTVCDCPCCRNYSRSYLHHLFEIKDTLAYRLATIHNLRFYTHLITHLRTHTAASAMDDGQSTRG